MRRFITRVALCGAALAALAAPGAAGAATMSPTMTLYEYCERYPPFHMVGIAFTNFPRDVTVATEVEYSDGSTLGMDPMVLPFGHWDSPLIGRQDPEVFTARVDWSGAARSTALRVDCADGAGATSSATWPAVTDPPPELLEFRVLPPALEASTTPTSLTRELEAGISIALSEPSRVHIRIRREPRVEPPRPVAVHPHVIRRDLPREGSWVPFTGTLGSWTLPPGRYVAIGRARDSAGQASERVTAQFRIRRR